MKSGGGAVLLRLDFLTVLEDEADIVGAVDDGIFDKQLFIYMRKIQKRKSELIKSVSVALRFIRSSRGLGRKTSGGRLLCADRSGTETQQPDAAGSVLWGLESFPNKQKIAFMSRKPCLQKSGF